jgi:hypothetical protein
MYRPLREWLTRVAQAPQVVPAPSHGAAVVIDEPLRDGCPNLPFGPSVIRSEPLFDDNQFGRR